MTLTIHLFASMRADLGPAVEVELPPGSTVADLHRELSERFPSFARLLAVSRIAVNQEFARDDQPLAPGDEIAVIPPVSGG
jgi:molybdopterin converting factor subunit 1